MVETARVTMIAIAFDRQCLRRPLLSLTYTRRWRRGLCAKRGRVGMLKERFGNWGLELEVGGRSIRPSRQKGPKLHSLHACS